MSQKEPEHIIDYIIKKTERRARQEFWKYYPAKKKYIIDRGICVCNNCKKLWSKVPKYIDSKRWRYYPKGNIPTLGKKRKNCPNCKKRGK